MNTQRPILRHAAVLHQFVVRCDPVVSLGNPPTVTGLGARVAWNRGMLLETFAERQAAMDWMDNAFGSKATAM